MTTLMNDAAFTLSAPLKEHQRTGVDWLVKRPRAVLADDVGLGKTVTALGLIAELGVTEQLPRTQHQLARVLWLTEANLIDQTAAEIQRFLPSASLLTGNDRELGGGGRAQLKLQERARTGIDLLVLSHETAHSRRQWLSRYEFAMVVIDEGSKVRGGGPSATTMAALAQRAGRALLMTATPLENNPVELWRVLSAAGVEGLWPKGTFEKRFVWFGPPFVDKWGREHPQPEGWLEPRVGEVRKLLSETVLRRTADDIGLPLPRLEQTTRWVGLTAAQRKAYETALNSVGLTGFQRKQMAGLIADGQSALVDALSVELRLRGADRQAVVYCETLEMLDLVEQALHRDEISLVRVEGKVKAPDRAAAVERFRAGDARVFLGSSVLERGLNLQHCNLLISLGASWNPKREQQREGRIRRIGSPHDVCEHLTLLPDTPLVRQRQIDALSRKSRTADVVGL
ncbi:DEAD/DEAH box helicase [Nocardioides sp. BP30]|uniref:DEAD/DEAH box helicase n=1 Tax=Nocardioides sp. BP30 TaxID=3036374 RepID=UPI0024688ACE|nr:DEAD/DEAH box helicase [Nocardioides sp. BP30]WGL51601.1 DEAD/DEAH box helicase [Nocardioides sp. BP30]